MEEGAMKVLIHGCSVRPGACQTVLLGSQFEGAAFFQSCMLCH